MNEREIGRKKERDRERGEREGDSWKFIACDFDSEKDKRNTRNIASVTNLLASGLEREKQEEKEGDREEK